MEYLGYLAAVCIGISLSMLGTGGAILAIPILIYLISLAPEQAIVISLFTVTVVSLSSSVSHWRAGNIDKNLILKFAPITMLGAYFGTLISHTGIADNNIRLTMFGIAAMTSGILMLRRPNYKDINQHIVNYWKLGLYGLLIGIYAGFIGVGGGFAMVPLLVIYGRYAMKQAAATALIIIALNSSTALSSYLSHGIVFQYQIAIPFLLCALTGTVVGLYLSRILSDNILRIIFACVVIFVSIFTITNTLLN